MTSFAAALRASPIPERIVAAWNALAMRVHPVALIVAAWALLVGPLVFFRGYNSDEGLAVSIARTALEDGQWLVPHVFNMRWVERPTLLSWVIAAISAPFGDVSQFTARLPIAVSVLLGSLLIYWLLRRVSASVAAALFGVAIFLACPLVIRSYVMITADLPLAVLLFLAFCLWWSGNAKGSVSVLRWIAIGVVLALAGLLKGPQPLAYFGLGVGVYVLAARAWRQLPGLILAGLICAAPLAAWYAAIYTAGDEQTWGTFMRMHPALLFASPPVAIMRTAAEALPALLLGGAFLAAQALGPERTVVRGFVPALASYAFVAAVLVLFWPGGSTPRYYFPAVLPLSVFAGLGYDRWNARRPDIVAPILVLTAGLLAYALAYALASPFLPQQYRQARIEADELTALVQAAPAPIYRIGDVALNVLPYVPGRVVIASEDEMAAAPGPAWMILPTAEAEALLVRRPALRVVTPLGDVGQWRLLRLDP
jgi:4-amino-4-deoxy-L-arabinose transferase-like glycosyltransferase